jgi:hypothetical protein
VRWLLLLLPHLNSDRQQRVLVRVSTAINVMISIINQPSKVLFPELSSAHLLLLVFLLAFLLAVLAFLLRARSCRVCDTRVPLFLELLATAANLHPNFKAYEASLSFESSPRAEGCIEVFEYLSPFLLLPSFYLTPPKWKKTQETNRGFWKIPLQIINSYSCLLRVRSRE